MSNDFITYNDDGTFTSHPENVNSFLDPLADRDASEIGNLFSTADTKLAGEIVRGLEIVYENDAPESARAKQIVDEIKSH